MLPTVAGFLLYAGTVVAAGGVAFLLLVAPRTSLSADAAASVTRRVGLLARVGAAAVLAGAAVDLTQQLATFRDPFVPIRDDLELLVGQTTWGRAWSARALSALLLLLPLPGRADGDAGARASAEGDVRSSALRPLRWAVAVGGALVLAAAPALSGHAIGHPRLPEVAVAAGTVHVLAASIWIGGIACLLLAARSAAARSLGPPPPLARLVDAFSPVALVCGVVVVGTGLVQSWLLVGGIQGLDSPYGRALLAKVALVTGVLAGGAFNWRRVRPLLRAGDPDVFRRSGAVEFLFAQGVLLATAVLTNLSPPA